MLPHCNRKLPLSVNFSMRLLPLSATKTFPFESTAMASGSKNCPSPLPGLPNAPRKVPQGRLRTARAKKAEVLSAPPIVPLKKSTLQTEGSGRVWAIVVADQYSPMSVQLQSLAAHPLAQLVLNAGAMHGTPLPQPATLMSTMVSNCTPPPSRPIVGMVQSLWPAKFAPLIWFSHCHTVMIPLIGWQTAAPGHRAHPSALPVTALQVLSAAASGWQNVQPMTPLHGTPFWSVHTPVQGKIELTSC